MSDRLNDTDLQILSLVQKDATISLENIAFHCDISLASAQRRLKNLKKNGVIEKQVAILNSDMLDYKMTFIIMVELERERIDKLDEFKRKVAKEDQVQQSYYITGDADFTLICIAKDMKDFEQLTHRLFFDDDNVRRFRTSVVMGRNKVGLEVPTDLKI